MIQIENHEKYEYYCGECNMVMTTIGGYKNHMTRSHQNTPPNNSSHDKNGKETAHQRMRKAYVHRNAYYKMKEKE